MRSYYTECLAASLLLLSCQLHANSSLIISEYIEGSGNNKALELANITNTDIDLSHFQIKIYFNGRSYPGRTINLNGLLAANTVFVLAHNKADAQILQQADQTVGGSFYNGDDVISLTQGSKAVDIIGQIGVDPGSQWGSGNISTQNNTLRRNNTISRGDSDGYDTFSPATQWQGFEQNTFDDLGRFDDRIESCGLPATLISAIQGHGESSPLAGSRHTVEAIVVGDFQGSDALGGYFLQEEDADIDNNPASSEGIFVKDSSVNVNIGERIRLSGYVVEKGGQTQLESVSSVRVCATAQSVTPAGISLPVTNLGKLESLEGMSVKSWQPLTVSETYNLGRYGQLLLSNGRLMNPTQIAMPGSAAQAVEQANQLNRIIMDDGNDASNPPVIPYPAPQLSAVNTVRVGDTVSNLQGVLDYAYRQYRIQPTEAPAITPSNARPAATQLPSTGQLTIASYNVLNYFNGNDTGEFPTSRGADTASEFERQRDKIISTLLTLDADIVGLVEIQNNGFGNSSAIADLVSGLNSAGAHYAYVDPGVRRIGTDQIMVGFIYKPATVALQGVAAILDSSVDPEFIDRKNRPAVAQTFHHKATRGRLTVAVNHFKSKGRSCNDVGDPDQGDGQGRCNLTRTKAARALVNWLATDPTNSGDTDTMIIGDLNAYSMEDPVRTIENAGFTNIVSQFTNNTYSYVYRGQSGSLDYVMVNEPLLRQVTGATVWHINADEPRVLDYNEEYKTAEQQVSLYNNDPYRSSDHDPIVVELNLTPTTSSENHIASD